MKWLVAGALLIAGCSTTNSLPQVETERVVDAGFSKPVALLVTPAALAQGRCDLLIHFHGASRIPFQSGRDRALCIASVHLGAGSSTYETPLSQPGAFERLTSAIEASCPRIGRRYLSGFSAGYGAIRAVLRDHSEAIDGVLLLDGLHTGYTTDGDVEGEKMKPFRDFAAAAARGWKRFVITHSQIVPGYYASTSETADDIVRFVGAPRDAVSRTRYGMQQQSETVCGGLVILGFRGETAPDHIAQFQAMPEVLPLLLD